MWKRIILWTATLLWATVIFCFSAQPATNSNQVSQKVSSKVIHTLSATKLMTGQDKAQSRTVHYVVRKGAHFISYMILGALLMALCKSYLLPSRLAALVALVVSVLYASGDEWHQSFVPGRSCQFSDVLLDGVGAAVGIALLYIGIRYMKKKKRNI